MRFRLSVVLLFTAFLALVPAHAQTIDAFVRGTRSIPEGSTQVRNGTAKLEPERGSGAEPA